MAEIAGSDGLKLEGDTSPTTSTLTTGISGMVDDDYATIVTANYWNTNYSYGIDLGSSQEVHFLYCYGVHSVQAGTDHWYSAGYDSVQVYKSDDNSSWTLIEVFDGPPVIEISSVITQFKCLFSTPQTARYFKIRNIDGYLSVGNSGASLRISEIEAYELDIVNLTGETIGLTFNITGAVPVGTEEIDLTGETLTLGAFTLPSATPSEIWRAICPSPITTTFNITGATAKFFATVPVAATFTLTLGGSMALIGRDLWELNSFITNLLEYDSTIEQITSKQSRITKFFDRDSSVR